MAETGEEARAAAIVKRELAEHPADTLWTGTTGPRIQAAIFLAPSMRNSSASRRTPIPASRC